MIVSQTLLNIAVVSGSVPATGIPLPFFSAGGSSLATTLFSAGLVVNVCRRSLLREEAAGRRGAEPYYAGDAAGREESHGR